MLAIITYWICVVLNVLVVTGIMMKLGIFNQHTVESNYSYSKVRLDVPIFNVSQFIALTIVISFLSICFWGLIFMFPYLMASILFGIVIFLSLTIYGIVKLAPDTLQARNIVDTVNTIKEKYFTKDLTEDKE